jgi:branched-chain amino acid transport system ATP-binding protein|tara:strand:+ start:3510 stop:4259 length:750 start_codon:yes stop_codon:yes gene_type:complete
MSEILKITNLSKNFGGMKALDNVNVNFKKNTLSAIIGPNGAGKTTLFNVICGSLKSNTGQILFNDTNITNLPTHKISRLGLGRTLQVKSIFNNLSVRENLYIALQSSRGVFRLSNSLSCEKEINDELLQISDLFNLKDKLDADAGSLSHGDISIIEMAIALCLKPNFLLLDEPICGMGPSETEQTIKIIKKLSKTTDILIIEHDMEAVFSLAEDIVVMSQGSIIAHGTPEQISKDEKVINTYLGEEEEV